MQKHTLLALAIFALAAALAPATAGELPEKPGGTFGRQLQLPSEPFLAPAYAFREAGARDWGFLEFRGQVVVANVWATWCGVCRKELPKLDRVQAKLGNAGVTVIALAQDADADDVRETLAKRGIQHLRAFQDLDSALTQSLGVYGVPTTFVIDKDGYIIGKTQGAADWDSDEALAFLAGLAAPEPKAQPTSVVPSAE